MPKAHLLNICQTDTIFSKLWFVTTTCPCLLFYWFVCSWNISNYQTSKYFGGRRVGRSLLNVTFGWPLLLDLLVTDLLGTERPASQRSRGPWSNLIRTQQSRQAQDCCQWANGAFRARTCRVTIHPSLGDILGMVFEISSSYPSAHDLDNHLYVFSFVHVSTSRLVLSPFRKLKFHKYPAS